MAFIDHVQCSSCNHYFAPEQIVTKHTGPSCPRCGNELATTDIFGVGDAFVGVGDDEGRGMTLEDALPALGSGAPSPNTRRPPPSSGNLPARREDKREGEGTMSALEALNRLKKG